MTTTPENMEDPLEDVLAPVRAAIALGMPVFAIPGTQVYASYLPQPNAGTYKTNVPPRPHGLHATITGAIDSMYSTVVGFWDFEFYRLRDTPWMTDELYHHAAKYEQRSLSVPINTLETLNAIEAINTLKEEWLNTHTKLDAVCTFLKIPYGGNITLEFLETKEGAHAIQFLHPWIVTHVIYN